MTNAFETIVAGGDGYPSCIDPTQDAITIRINSLYVVEESGLGGEDNLFEDQVSTQLNKY